MTGTMGRQRRILQGSHLSCTSNWLRTLVAVRCLSNAPLPLRDMVWLRRECEPKCFETDRVGYRRLSAVATAGSVIEGRTKGAKGAPPYVDKAASHYMAMGDEANIAQTHPKHLCEAMLERAQKEGVEVIHGRAEGVTRDDDGSVDSLFVDGDEMPVGDALLLTMGPWADVAREWFTELRNMPKVMGKW